MKRKIHKYNSIISVTRLHVAVRHTVTKVLSDISEKSGSNIFDSVIYKHRKIVSWTFGLRFNFHLKQNTEVRI